MKNRKDGVAEFASIYELVKYVNSYLPDDGYSYTYERQQYDCEVLRVYRKRAVLVTLTYETGRQGEKKYRVDECSYARLKDAAARFVEKLEQALEEPGEVRGFII